MADPESNPGEEARPEPAPSEKEEPSTAPVPSPLAEVTAPRASAAPAAEAPSESPGAGAPKVPADGGPLGAYEVLATSARLPDLVAITQRIVTTAAEHRRADWRFATEVATMADDAKLSRADADTPYGNALKVLESGPEGDAERALACALWAHAIAEARRDDPERLASDVLWLAAHTAFDATSLFDRALGEDAMDLWTAIADRVRRIGEGNGGTLGRGEAIVGCAALAASPGAAKFRTELSSTVKDAVLLRVLGATESAARGGQMRLEGEAIPAPRGYVATTLLALTGLLFVMHAARLFARLALSYRCPAEVTLSGAGVRVHTRTEMLGRTLREREHVIARAGLVRVVREVRYPRAAFYAGLFALALGSWIGVRALVDGVRAASPSLLLVGVVVVALGIGADFVLGSLLPGGRARCRVLFVPRTGRTLCIGDVDAARATEALSQLLPDAR